jgi:hypothetical protein
MERGANRRGKEMRKALITGVALAALSLTTVTSAQASSVYFGFGSGPYYGGYYDDDYYYRYHHPYYYRYHPYYYYGARYDYDDWYWRHHYWRHHYWYHHHDWDDDDD